jgi:multidrug efflux pump
MTITLAAVYTPIALQGGLTGSLFREFALTLAGAVTISGIVALTLSPGHVGLFASPGHQDRGFSGVVNRAFDGYGARMRGTSTRRWALAALSTRPGSWSACWPFDVHHVSERARAAEDQGVVFGVVNTPIQFHPRPGQLLDARSESHGHGNSGGGLHLSADVPVRWLLGRRSQTMGRRKRSAFQIVPEVQKRVGVIPGIQTFPILPPALPGGGQFPVEFVLSSTAESSEILGFATTLQQKAATSGMFAFPPLIDVKVDQPESQIEIDRDKVAELGLSLETVASDLAAALGGNFVNRFSVAGRSYKVIPQLLRAERMNPSQLSNIYITGPNGQLIALDSIAKIHNAVSPRSLNRFQQLNAVKISGVAIRPLDEALKYLEVEAAKILPQGYTVDYTGESRQLRTEGNKFLPAFILAVVLIFLVLSAQFNSFRDPFVILAGSVPLGMFGALALALSQDAEPEHALLDGRLDDDHQCLLPGGPCDFGGACGQERHSDRPVREHVASARSCQARSGQAGGRDPSATDSDDQRRHHLRPFSPHAREGTRRRCPQQHRIGPGGGNGLGDGFTLFFVPAIYVLLARDHRGAKKERRCVRRGSAPAAVEVAS